MHYIYIYIIIYNIYIIYNYILYFIIYKINYPNNSSNCGSFEKRTVCTRDHPIARNTVEDCKNATIELVSE